MIKHWTLDFDFKQVALNNLNCFKVDQLAIGKHFDLVTFWFSRRGMCPAAVIIGHSDSIDNEKAQSAEVLIIQTRENCLTQTSQIHWLLMMFWIILINSTTNQMIWLILIQKKKTSAHLTMLLTLNVWTTLMLWKIMLTTWTMLSQLIRILR